MRQLSIVVASMLRAAFPPARGTAAYTSRSRWTRRLAPRTWAEAYVRLIDTREARRSPSRPGPRPTPPA